MRLEFKTICWISNKAFSTAITGMKDMIKTVINVDSQMTQLKRVMNVDTNFESMLRGSIVVATDLGRSISDVNEQLIGFAGMGFDENQTLALTKTAMLFQNISELTPDQAINTMTSAMTAFNIKAEDSIQIADKLNEISNHFAVTSQDLALSLNNAGSAANSSGISMDRVLGDTTAIATATKESGSVIGDSLKTIYSRLSTMSNSEETFKAVGISVKDMNGKVKNSSVLLDELAGRWSGLSGEQQQNTAISLAGQLQFTRFLALMQQYDVSTQATATSINSQGSAMSENSKYLESFEARIQTMKTAWETFSLSMGNAVIGDSIILITGLLTSLTNTLTFSVDNLGGLPTMLGLVGASAYLLNTSFKGLSTSLARSIAGMLGIAPVTQVASVGFLGLGGAANFAKGAIRGLLASTLVGGAFVLLGFVLEKLIGQFADASEAQSNYFEDLQQDITDTDNRIKSLENLSKQLKDNSKSQEELNSLYEQTSQSAPNIIDHYTNEGIAVYKSKEAIDELIKSEKALNLEKEKRLYNEKSNSLKETAKDISSNKKDLRKQQEDYNYSSTKFEALDFAEKYISNNKLDEIDQSSEEYTKKIEFLNNEVKRIFADSEQYISDSWLSIEIFSNNGISNAVTVARSELNKASGAFEDTNAKIKEGVNSFSDQFKTFNGNLISDTNTTDKNVKLFLDIIGESYATSADITKDNSDKLIFEYEDFASAINTYLTDNKIDITKTIESGGIDELIDKLKNQFPKFAAVFEKMRSDFASSSTTSKHPVFNNLGVEIGRISSIADEAATKFKDLKEKVNDNGTFEGYTGSLKDLISTQEELDKHFEDTLNSLSLLSSAYETLNKGEQLSEETLLKLIDQYPDLASHLANTNDLTFNKGELIKKVAEWERQARVEELRNSLNSVENTRIELEHKQGLYKEFYGRMLEIGYDSDSFSRGWDAPPEELTEEENARLKEVKEEANRIKVRMKLLNKPLSFNSGSGKSSKTESAYNKDQLDATQAIINEINKYAVDRVKLNSQISDRSKELENEERYAEALSKTTVLLASQKKEVDLLKTANNSLESERNKLQKASGHNMTSWLDDQGQASQAYIKLYNSSSEAGQKSLKSQFDKWKLFTEAIKENKTTIDDLNKTLTETANYQDSLKLKDSQQSLDKQSALLEDIDYNMSIAEKTQAMYLEGTEEYNAQQIVQNKIIQDKIEFLKNEISTTEERLRQGDLTNDQIELYTEYLHTNTLALLDAQKVAQSLAETYANDVIENYKKMIEQQRDLELDAIDVRTRAEDLRHKLYMSNIDEEYKKFEDFINAQLKAMNDQNETDDYESELTKKLKERQEILDHINKLSMDNSMEAKAKRKDLQEQLGTKDEEIDRFKLERERTLRQTGLQDQLEDRKKYDDKLKDSEDKLHDNAIDNLDDEKKKTQQKYKDILEDEKNFYEIKKRLLSEDQTVVNGVLDELKGNYAFFFDFLKQQAFETSQAFENINYRIQQDANKLDNFPNTGSSGSGSGSTGNTTTPDKTSPRDLAWQEYLTNKKEAEELGSNKGEEYQSLNARNTHLRNYYGFQNGSYDELKDLKVYHNGGEVGVDGTTTQSWWEKILKSDEIPSILRKGEVVLDDPLQFINNLLNKITKGASNLAFNKASTSTSLGGTSPSTGVIIEKVIIQASDKETGGSLLNKFETALNRANKIGVFKSGG